MSNPAATPAALYIGLMSGTSLDGLDGVLVDLTEVDQGRLRVLAHAHAPFDAALRDTFLALNARGDDELHRAALAANAWARHAAMIVDRLLAAGKRAARDVTAIGAHGQTVRHRPGEFDGTGYTLQLNQPALLAELTGIDVVADLRSRDVAAGGQGAPLVPAFHRAVFGRPGNTLAVLNVGGMSNLTALHADGRTIGFDCGPGNALLDLWCQRHHGQSYDDRGAWAATGRVDTALLARLQGDAYFAAPPPKSTGRDRFHAEWLDGHLQAHAAAQGRVTPPADVQASLLELTAWACASDTARHAPGATRLLVCGGGAMNDLLMARLAQRLPGVAVVPTDDAGLPAQQVEAVAFAWLARQCVQRRPGNLAAVTGARGPRVLGAIHPGA